MTSFELSSNDLAWGCESCQPNHSRTFNDVSLNMSIVHTTQIKALLSKFNPGVGVTKN